jgi:hypothetical protein
MALGDKLPYADYLSLSGHNYHSGTHNNDHNMIINKYIYYELRLHR